MNHAHEAGSTNPLDQADSRSPRQARGGMALFSPTLRHCERSEAIPRNSMPLDCFAALAMTNVWNGHTKTPAGECGPNAGERNARIRDEHRVGVVSVRLGRGGLVSAARCEWPGRCGVQPGSTCIPSDLSGMIDVGVRVGAGHGTSGRAAPRPRNSVGGTAGPEPRGRSGSSTEHRGARSRLDTASRPTTPTRYTDAT